MRYKFLLFAFSLALGAFHCQGQEGVNVLFVGNSYTEVNNLPLMVQQVAQSMGETLVFQSNTPGGCTFRQHCSNSSMELIRQGGWDFVVLQEQSQYPSFPQGQVEAEVFPFAQRLVDSVYRHSPCAEPVFYMTWGRKYGDAGNAPFFPVLGTYEGMDSMLCLRYTYMAQAFDASLCPVGRVWRRLRERHPEVELYQADNSHPSLAGTYAAACAFYTLFFHRDPDSIAFDAGLEASVAQLIRSAAHDVVFLSLSSWRRPRPEAHFQVLFPEADSLRPLFVSSSLHVDSLLWRFGDGAEALSPSADSAVSHLFADGGTYEVTLVALRHCMADTMTLSLTLPAAPDTADNPPAAILDVEASSPSLTLFPNPAANRLMVRLPQPCATVSALLLTLDGREVLRADNLPATAHSGALSLSLPPLPPAVYILRLSTPSATYTARLSILQQ